MNRRLARLRAAQALYQMDLTGSEMESAIESVLEDNEKQSEFFTQLVQGTTELKTKIDETISANLEGWTISRMGHVDRAIIRMAMYEMLEVEDIPVNVTFNEAIELAKAFGGEEAGRFVNGVLSKSIETLNLDRKK
ncbi:transcription antitermination protein NusB [Alkalihalophilus pseudofirmus OF4]|uniref:Transcription antitermination protein NusB n=1 Tax=Alkalihalophilus pseudofirmus (strain ATCC BAA-2126 / JCM 17055 / OF4) TaxID=398511 RepID=D3FUU8_ALKPO|nr:MULTISPECIES: transcription antitermination factor NusB [Alkalihalophilus]ADC48374.1 transcription antitermination protein NusB [Alkalihalophilus pseudofirmus OF4]MED1601129.1 transcription antitermination factor NusB [Alkalihalophilus marmarensis]WEG15874.1 transcription antitermination factor NusB [Alkalihalophilus pseudofirmus]